MTRSRWPDLLAVTLILLLAVYLRLANVAVNPAWYTDEGTHLDIAQHLLQGRVQYLAIDASWLLFSRLPLFELLLSGAAFVGGVSMHTLRAVTALLGVTTVAMLYVAARRTTRQPVEKVRFAKVLTAPCALKGEKKMGVRRPIVHPSAGYGSFGSSDT
jgi:4-amino-4-deoxy-L-arabinose transferase-like glycosyltransferase